MTQSAIQEGGCTQLPRPGVPPTRLRVSPREVKRFVAILVLATIAVGGVYWWRRDRWWTINDPTGREKCRVQSGWSEHDVAAHCGVRDGRGIQVKVFASKGWNPLGRACAPAGDVYGERVVLYDCDGAVYAVERMPLAAFAYPSP